MIFPVLAHLSPHISISTLTPTGARSNGAFFAVATTALTQSVLAEVAPAADVAGPQGGCCHGGMREEVDGDTEKKT